MTDNCRLCGIRHRDGLDLFCKPCSDAQTEAESQPEPPWEDPFTLLLEETSHAEV